MVVIVDGCNAAVKAHWGELVGCQHGDDCRDVQGR